MLVLPRRTGEAVLIGDDIEIALANVNDEQVELRIVRSELRGRLTTVIFEGHLRAGDSVEFAPGCRCQVGDVRDGVVRLGIDAPSTINVHRREVLQALRRERRRNEAD